jgi:membrane protein DedA with SNARE-associated domain
MTATLIQYIETMAAYAPVWGFFLIFFFMTVESSFIPFPSEVVMIPAGFMAARGELTFGSPLLDAAVSIVAGLAGSLAGAYVNYYLFSWLGTPFLERSTSLPAMLHRASVSSTARSHLRLSAAAIRQLISIPAALAHPLTFTLTAGAGIWLILTVVGYTIGAHTAA